MNSGGGGRGCILGGQQPGLGINRRKFVGEEDNSVVFVAFYRVMEAAVAGTNIMGRVLGIISHNIGSAVDVCSNKNRGVIRYVNNIDSVEF